MESAGGGTPEVCDLANLATVRAVADRLRKADIPLDVLCLNAGVSPSRSAAEPQLTVDGFEATMGINHLGHFCLASLVQPLLSRSRGRIVVTASGVHDPASPGGTVQGDPTTGATLGTLSGLRANSRQMADGAAQFNGAKAYHDSKLANVLFMREGG